MEGEWRAGQVLGNIRSSEEQFDRLAGGLGVESECGLLRLEAVFRCQPTVLRDVLKNHSSSLGV